MVVTDDSELAARLRRLRTHGSSPKYYHPEVGGNFRLDALQAAVVRVKLRRLPEWSASRRANAFRYKTLFAEHRLGDAIVAPDDTPGHVYNQFVIRAQSRDALKTFLRDHGVATEVYYPLPLHLQECFDQLGYVHGDLPHAEGAARSALALPVYPELGLDQLRHIVTCLGNFVKSV